MDAATVRGLLLVTLDGDANNRRNAELQLKHVESEGLIDVLLGMLQSEQDPQIRLSAVIYLKNQANRGWKRSEIHVDERLITDEEKERVRARLLPVLATSEGAVRIQVIDIIHKVLLHDFPDNWPTFFSFTMELLNTNNQSTVVTGLVCLLAVCRTYRYKVSDKSSRDQLDKIIDASFPRLLAICNELVNQDGDEAGEMLHLALKVYKNAAWMELPRFLQQQSTIIAWCEVFLRTVSKPLPAPVMAEPDPLEREKNCWVKAKKWAVFMLNRLFTRYGTTIGTSKSNPDTAKFTKAFTTTIAPEIMRHYLQEVEKWASHTVWLSRPCLYWMIVFLEACIMPKETWAHLRPHLTNLVSHFLFPVLCLKQSDLEKFEEDPEEYLHGKLSPFEEAPSPDLAAQQFLIDLTKNRRTETFEILKFVNAIVTEYEEAADDKKNHIAKEGALRMIGTLAPVILGKKSPIADQVEYFLVRFVFPDFKSSHGFLRARACDTIEKFERLDFKDQQNLMNIYHQMLDCMADPALPVRVTASLALQPLIRHDVIRNNMGQNIPTIMQQLLKLANEVDVEGLANVMEDFVEVFSTELTPFAVALCEQLRDTYLRIVSEVQQNAKDQQSDEEEGLDYLDDKSMNALGVLQTIGTLILTLESTPDILFHIENILMPVITVTLENKKDQKKLLELYNEVFEIVDSCTFAAKSISANMWKAFELMSDTVRNGGEVYLEDMLPALDNFIQYGAAHIIQTPDYIHSLSTMVTLVLDGSNVIGVDKVCACKVAENMMLSLRGHIDMYIPTFVGIAMTTLSKMQKPPKLLKIHVIEMVLNAIYYNPVLAITVLESKGWAGDFFEIWPREISAGVFVRVHDKKLCILAISALLTMPPESIPQSIASQYLILLSIAVELFQTLPAAMKLREDALRDDFRFEAGSFGYAGSEDWDDDGVAWDEGEAGGDPKSAEETVTDAKDESTAYLDFLTEEVEKLSRASQAQDGSKAADEHEDEDDDTFGEEGIPQDSLLDKIEPYQVFRASYEHLQQEQPQLYASLISKLPREQLEILQSVIIRAVEAANQEMFAQQQQQQQQQQQHEQQTQQNLQDQQDQQDQQNQLNQRQHQQHQLH